MRSICPALALFLALGSGTAAVDAAQPPTPPDAPVPSPGPASTPDAAPDAAPAPSPEPAPDPALPTDEAEEGSAQWALDMPEQLDISLTLGMGARLDDAPLYSITERQGLLFGMGLDLFFSRRVSFGLGFEHLDLGAEDSGLTQTGQVTLTRDLNAFWANLRLYAVRTEAVGGFIRLGLGSVWQSADLTGAVWSQIRPDRNVTWSCEGSDSANVALRADVGLDVALTAGLRLQAALGLDSYRLSDELLDDCVPGAGTAAVFGLRTGFAYGAEL